MDGSALQAFLLSTVAGLSTLLGAVVVFFSDGESESPLCCALGFAAGVMITVSFSDLFPESAEMLLQVFPRTQAYIVALLAFLGGVIFVFAIDRLVPEGPKKPQKGRTRHSGRLYHVGLVSMLAIVAHNLPEGMATFMAGYQDLQMGLMVTIAITLHNIPEGITVAMPIYYSTGSKGKALFYTFLSGMSEPLGALLAFLVLKPFISPLVLGIIFAVVCGIMLFIGFVELIPASLQYKMRVKTWLSVLAGCGAVLISHFVMA